MNNKNPLQQLQDIKDIMSKSTQFLSLSGLSGIIAGTIALIGATITYFYFEAQLNSISSSAYDNFDLLKFGAFHIRFENLIFVSVMSLSVFTIALLSAIILGKRKAKKQNIQFWTPVAKKMVINLAIPLISGGVLSLQMLYFGMDILIPGITLIFYGLGLIGASKYTIGEVRYLGLTLIILGLISGFVCQYSLFIWALGFGVMHILYGIIMFKKYEYKNNH